MILFDDFFLFQLLRRYSNQILLRKTSPFNQIKNKKGPLTYHSIQLAIELANANAKN